MDRDHAAMTSRNFAAQSYRGRFASGGWALPLPVLLLLAPFLIWPLGAILWHSFMPEGELSSSVLGEVFRDRFYWERLFFTITQATASTILALAVGLPAAYVFSHLRFPGRALARALITIPFVLPTLVAALAFQQLFGQEGWFNTLLSFANLGPVEPLGTIWLILVAHVFYNVAIVIRLVSGVWANLDPSTEEAARLLGAGRIATLRTVTLPALTPAIAAAAALVFVFSFTSFGVVLILGGPGLDTLEVVIYRLTTRLVDLPAAAVLSLVQIATTITALGGYSLIQRRSARPLLRRSDRARQWQETTLPERMLALAVAAVLSLLILTPLITLVYSAFTLGASDGITAANFERLFQDTGRVSFIEPLNAIRWSLTFALAAALLAVVVGALAATAIAHSRGHLATLADALLMVPLAVPAVVLGFGFLITFNDGLYDLRGSAWLIVIAHTLIAYPFVVRSVLAVLRTLDRQLIEAARVLGASPLDAWRHVELPLVWRALAIGAGFAFVISLGEFGATAVLQRREFATLPVAIFTALGRPGEVNLGQAIAMATLLMAITASGLLLIERFRYRDIGEF
jgi:thiamine transport system permease protein